MFSGLGQRTEMVDTILKSSTHGLKYFLVKCCDLTNFPGISRITPLVLLIELYFVWFLKVGTFLICLAVGVKNEIIGISIQIRKALVKNKRLHFMIFFARRHIKPSNEV